MPSPLTGSDRVDVRSWVTDLTYAEIHAFIWGFALAGVATLAQSEVFGALFVGLLLYAFGGRTAAKRDSKVDLQTVPEQVSNQIRRQPHYYIAGGMVGVIVGFVGLSLGIDATGLDPFTPF